MACTREEPFITIVLNVYCNIGTDHRLTLCRVPWRAGVPPRAVPRLVAPL
ncbi:hypothetical protein MPER_06941 [Moniliophthora perniciosa FA553]|nr:hypothetical protein MPER_06941 [Moniliophthora perniciosa FA553]